MSELAAEEASKAALEKSRKAAEKSDDVLVLQSQLALALKERDEAQAEAAELRELLQARDREDTELQALYPQLRQTLKANANTIKELQLENAALRRREDEMDRSLASYFLETSSTKP